MNQYLAGLPNPNQGPAFFDDYMHYCQQMEWRSYITKNVGVAAMMKSR